MSVMGTIASVLELSQEPAIARLFFWSASFCAPAAACLGSPESSWIEDFNLLAFYAARFVDTRANNRIYV